MEKRKNIIEIMELLGYNMEAEKAELEREEMESEEVSQEELLEEFGKAITAEKTAHWEEMEMTETTYRNDAHVKKEKAKNVKAENIGIRLSYGNKKLEDTDKSAFMIWSITSEKDERLNMVTCPLATKNCVSLCYAKKAERMYPTVRSRRSQNLEMSLQEDFVNNMIEQIEFDMNRKKYKGKNILFRIHEAGDFYSQEYTEKWVKIANHFKDQNITFMAYTKSLPFVAKVWEKFGRENTNIVFKSSIWDDTKPVFVKMTETLNMSVFTAYEKKEEKDYSDYFKCPSMQGMGCGTCAEKFGGCYNTEKDTAIEIH